MKRQVIFIMVDTQNTDVVSCYNKETKHTPNIDRIADGGVIYKNAYCVQPVCGPSRSAIFSGRFPSTNGMSANGLQLGTEIKTVGEYLQDEGIPSGYIGKWHLDGGDYFGKGICPDGYVPKYWYDMKMYVDELPSAEERLKSRKAMTRIEPDHVINEEDTFAYRCTTRALDFIEEYKDQDFFLTISYDEPHDPSQCPNEFVKKVQSDEYKLRKKPNSAAPRVNKPDIQDMWGEALNLTWEMFEGYYQNGYIPCNNFVDYEIGKVLDSIEEKLDNPLIIYTADHGDMMLAHGLLLKGAAMYEEITKIPLLIKGGKFGESENTTPVSHIDLLPTIMDHFELETPKLCDGESLTNYVDTNENRDVYMEFFRYETELDGFLGWQPIRSVVNQNYKLNINLNSTDELYNLKDDPYELTNLIDNEEYFEIRNELHDKILDHMDKIVDPLRGYTWACRPWRTDKKPSYHNSGYTRQRCEKDEIRLDYATANPVTEELRKKGFI